MRLLLSQFLGVALVICAAAGCAKAQNPPPTPPKGFKAVRDLDYGGKDNSRQKLDLYLPEKKPETPLPLIVFIHGGGWEGGSKNDCGVIFTLMQEGFYAGASLNYRLTDQAKWPAQIHDCKAAMRWLRAHAGEYGFDAERIGLFGISAGGHLVSLLGTSHDVTELDGEVGSKGAAAKIACVADFAGPSNFLTFEAQGSIIDAQKPGSAVGKLFGGPMREHMPEAKEASPITYVTRNDPPFLIIHGTKDALVPYGQAVEFGESLGKAGVSHAMLTGKDGPHVFVSMELVVKLRAFFDHWLRGGGATVETGFVKVR